MKTEKIIKFLGQIEKIAKFQQKRIKGEAINKEITLRLALDIIGGYNLKILKELK